jgi:hypothetical protein
MIVEGTGCTRANLKARPGRPRNRLVMMLAYMLSGKIARTKRSES